VLRAKNRLGLIFFPAFDWAIDPTHPEREERLLYTQDQVFEEGIEDIEGIKFYNPEIASQKDVERVHICVPDVKTRVTNSHLISAGGAIKAAKLVMNREVDKAFAIVRPPGHHAHRVVLGDRGFCIINIEAVMLEKLRKDYGEHRIVIVDTDCHHGDGTQDIYWNDPDTLFISFHQDGRTLYPGTGFLDEFGGPAATGYNINIPLPPETGDEGFLYVLDNLVIPIIREYKPYIIINSAGQDNHYTDPITNMRFSAQGYAELNHRLNPDIAILEGGYSIEGALPYVNTGIILAMAGLDYSHVREPDYNPSRLKQSPEIGEYIKRLCEEIYTRWQNRKEIAHKLYNGKNYVVRKRRIYYDTDGIMENQIHRINICPHCSGLETIESSSDRGYTIFAVSIPRNACKECIDKGYNCFNNIDERNYFHVYLQDRANDYYKRK